MNILYSVVLSLLFITGSLADRTYGPVKQNDYLSIIVKKSFPKSSLTNDQIMVAILRANPEAFRGGNINFLKQAVTLVLPSEKAITTISSKEASAVIAKHRVFFKQGKTGNLTNKLLILTAEKDDPTDDSTEDSTSVADGALQADDSIQAEGSSQTDTKIPSKIKIEIRRQKQEKDNKYKHVTALEGISKQQNKTLKTLDEQIEILEEQLKIDTERSNKKNSIASDSPFIESSSDVTDEDTQAENAISSLETKLSETEGNNQEDKKKKNEEVDEKQTQTISDKPSESDPLSTEIEAPTESLDQEPKDITNTSSTDKAVETSEEEETTDPFVQETIEAPAVVNEPQVEKAMNSSVQQATDTPIKEEATSSSEDTIDTSTQETISTDATKETTNPLPNFLQSVNKTVILAALGLFALGIFLSYFFLGRGNKQQVSSLNEPLRKADFKETIGKPLEIPDQESLLNPVIKTKKQDPSNTPLSDTISHTQQRANSNQDTEVKINMARAYMDMGHIDASKEILEEVLKEGSEEQKETVRQMLSML